MPETYAEVKGEADTRTAWRWPKGVTSWQIVQELNQIDVLEGRSRCRPKAAWLPTATRSRPATPRRLIARMQRRRSNPGRGLGEPRRMACRCRQPRRGAHSRLDHREGDRHAGGTPARVSVFNNRLEQGMRLQTDPTVIYGITRGEGVLGRGLRQSELRRETPWNTYVIDGLPPTPIANPGRASIEAALNPDETGYIFFVAKTLDPSDGHNFAETLAEHNGNVAAYRALEAQRDN